MKRISAFFCFVYFSLVTQSKKRLNSKVIRKEIERMTKSGYTKVVFDVEGYTVVIQSHKHKENNRA